MAACVFCQRNDALTKEHVWPQWLAEVLTDRTPQRFVRTSVHGVQGAWSQPMFKQTVRAVCSDCNGGWMSGLEGDRRRVLSPMIRGMAVQLGADTQKLIATWALKTALMAMRRGREEHSHSVCALAVSRERATRQERDRDPCALRWAWAPALPRVQAAVVRRPLASSLGPGGAFDDSRRRPTRLPGRWNHGAPRRVVHPRRMAGSGKSADLAGPAPADVASGPFSFG
jgi:hypothetical protein